MKIWRKHRTSRICLIACDKDILFGWDDQLWKPNIVNSLTMLPDYVMINVLIARLCTTANSKRQRSCCPMWNGASALNWPVSCWIRAYDCNCNCNWNCDCLPLVQINRNSFRLICLHFVNTLVRFDETLMSVLLLFSATEHRYRHYRSVGSQVVFTQTVTHDFAFLRCALSRLMFLRVISVCINCCLKLYLECWCLAWSTSICLTSLPHHILLAMWMVGCVYFCFFFSIFYLSSIINFVCGLNFFLSLSSKFNKSFSSDTIFFSNQNKFIKPIMDLFTV